MWFRSHGRLQLAEEKEEEGWGGKSVTRGRVTEIPYPAR